MKGFIRILEAIIASLVLLASVSFFFILEPQPTEWDIALLQTRAEDGLATLDKTGVLKEAVFENNPDMLYNNLNKIFPSTTRFFTGIENRVYPIIYVSFIGSDAELSELENSIGTSPIIKTFRNRDVEIRIQKTTIDSINEQTDMIFIWGVSNLPSDENELRSLLEKGKSIILFSDINQAGFNSKGNVLRNLFGLELRETGNTNEIKFHEYTNFQRKSFVISNYFQDLGGIKSHEFTGFNDALTQNQVRVDNNTIIGSPDFSYVKVNYDIENGNGRTVWFAGYDPTSDAGNTATALLAAMFWAASESYDFNPADVRGPIGNLPYYEYKYFVYDYEAYSVNVKVWQVFY